MYKASNQKSGKIGANFGVKYVQTEYLNKIKKLTQISNDHFNGVFEQLQLDSNWTSNSRKSLHEDYWTKTILLPAQKKYVKPRQSRLMSFGKE